MRKITLAAAAALAVVSTTAFASVTLDYNSDTLSGFIGKGDVQSVFGFNNNQMQQKASSVQFHFGDHMSVTFTCQFEAGQSGNVQSHDWDRSGDLTATWTGASRNNSSGLNGSSTGWNVVGTLVAQTGSINSIDGVPVIGDPCPLGTGTVTDVGTPVESGATLTATIDGNTKNIPITTLTGI